jgi:hypothetical protein
VNGATLTTDRLENANKAYFFNGSSSVAVTTPWNKPHTGEITHSFWFNPSTNLNSSTERQNLLGAPTIQSYYVGSSQGWYGGSGLVFEIWGNFFPPKFYSVPMEFAPNTWHHVIIQAKEFGFARITIDGITHELEMPNFTFADPDPATGIKILIGMEWNRLYFKGKMDDVRIYNRALTEAEIKQLYGVASSTEIVATVGEYTASGQLLGRTGIPLGNVTIHIGDRTTTTDAAGNWSLNGLTAGKYDIVATKGQKSCVDSEIELLANGQYQQRVNYACDVITYGDDNASFIAIWQFVDGSLRYVDTVSAKDFDAKFQEGTDYQIVDRNGEYLLEGLDNAGNITSMVEVVRIP